MANPLLLMGVGHSGSEALPAYSGAPFRLFGYNLVPASGDNWPDLYADLIADTNWNSWIKPQIDKASDLGANVIRIIGDGGVGLDAGTYTEAQYLAAVRRIIEYCQSLGLYFYGCALSQQSITSGFTDTQMRDWAVAYVQNLLPYSNVIACDLLQEISAGVSGGYTWTNAATTMVILYMACRAVAPSMPFTFSSIHEVNDFPNLYRYCDFLDFHANGVNPTADYFASAMAFTYDLPWLGGEHGEVLSEGQTAQEAHFNNFKTNGHDHNSCHGSLTWAVTDQDVVDTNQWGVTDASFVNRTYMTDILATYAKDDSLSARPRLTAKRIAPDANTLLVDNMIDDDGTAYGSHTPDDGPAPTLTGTWAITGFRNFCTALSGGAGRVIWDVGDTDYTITAVVRHSTSPQAVLIVFRYQDANNYWAVYWYPTAALTLYEIVAGAPTARDTMAPDGVGFVANNDYRVTVRVLGTVVTATVVGGGQSTLGQSQILGNLGYASMSTFLTETEVGVATDTATGLGFDSIKVTSVVDDWDVYDTFHGVDATPIASHAISPVNTVAGSWAAANGSGVINGNRLMSTAVDFIAVMDYGASNADVRATFKWDTSINAMRLIALVGRYADLSNRYTVRVFQNSGSPQLEIYETISGASTLVAVTPVMLSHLSFYTLRAVFNGSTITASIGEYTLTYGSAVLTSNTKFGPHTNVNGDFIRDFGILAV